MDSRAHGALESVAEAWPCQRLRMGWGLVLFFLFEVTLGRRLPEVLPYLALGLGLALLGSALYAIRVWRLKAQIALIMEALDHSAG
jgi:hypothetical protein